jgi:SAM-dependent methyltransferase
MSEPQRVQGYNSQGTAYHDAFSVFLAHTDQKLKAREWLDRLVQSLPRRQVFIDAGAGNGQVTAWFVDAFERTIAIEPNVSLRADLEKECPEAEVLADMILDANPSALGDLILCSHVMYYIDDAQWLPSLEHMTSWLSDEGVAVVVLQNHATDCMRMLEHFLGRRFELAALARRFEAVEGEDFRVEITTVPARIVTSDFESAYTIAEFMLNLLPITQPPERAALEEYVRSRFTAPGGGFRFSCDQDFLQIRPRE